MTATLTVQPAQATLAVAEAKSTFALELVAIVFGVKSWGAHETGGASEATWAEFATGGATPTTWADLET